MPSSNSFYLASHLESSERRQCLDILRKLSYPLTSALPRSTYCIVHEDPRIDDDGLLLLQDRPLKTHDYSFDGLCLRFAMREGESFRAQLRAGRKMIMTTAWLRASDTRGSLIRPNSSEGRKWRVKVRLTTPPATLSPPSSIPRPSASSAAERSTLRRSESREPRPARKAWPTTTPATPSIVDLWIRDLEAQDALDEAAESDSDSDDETADPVADKSRPLLESSEPDAPDVSLSPYEYVRINSYGVVEAVDGETGLWTELSLEEK